MESGKIKILLVDDQETVLKGLRMRLALEEDMVVIGEVKDGQAAILQLAQVHPDIIVMDLEMPRMDGITATKAIRDLALGIAVIVLSMHDDPLLRSRADEAGASAFVEKRDGAVSLINEIRRAFEIKKRSVKG